MPGGGALIAWRRNSGYLTPMKAQPPKAFQRPVSPHVMFETLLGASGAEALPTHSQSKAESFRALDAIGVQLICEQLATGRLPVEVALLYEIPILHFRAWMKLRITDDMLQEVRSAAAEALQVKSMLTLSANLHSPAAASQAKSLSDRFAKIAEALAPDEWSPSKIVPPSALPSVSITFNGLTIASQPQGVTIEGALGEACSPELRDGGESGSLQGGFPPVAPLQDDSPLARFSAEELAHNLLSRVDPYTSPYAFGERHMSEGLDG